MSAPEFTPRWYHVGPHGYYDLVRLARRGRTILMRVAYIAVLFAVLAMTYYNTEGITNPHRVDINTRARIAQRFSLAILETQNVAVLILMPIYLAVSIYEERDKRTLGLLFTTHLTTREIVLGKLLSRIVQVGSVLLAGLPILAFVQLWGGIDMPTIAFFFWSTGLLLVSVGALSIAIATYMRGLLAAIMLTYGILAAIFVSCLCTKGGDGDFLFTIYFDGWSRFDNAWVLTLTQGLTTVWVIRYAGDWLEEQRQEEPQVEVVSDKDSVAARYSEPPPISDNPLFWKERYLKRSVWNDVPFGLLPLVGCYALTYYVAEVGSPRQIGDGVFSEFANLLLLMCILFAVYLVFVTFRLTGCIVQERQQQTLDSLLTLPMTPWEFLQAKVAGNLLHCWSWLLPCSLIWLTIFLVHAPLRGFILLHALCIHLAFFAMLGLGFSIVCRTALAAYISVSLVMMFLMFGTLVLGELFPIHRNFFVQGLNPIGCWVTLGEGRPIPAQVSCCLFLYALFAISQARLALWQFKRLARGE